MKFIPRLICSLAAFVAIADIVARGAEIVVGQTAALSGPTQALGIGMKTGLETAFREINEAGGVGGKTIRLVTLDDGYEPKRAAENARTLIEQEKVFLLIGCVGTPTSIEILPVCNAAGVPFFGAFTGSGALRTPYNPLVVNMRASYAQEIERIVTLLTDGRGLTKISCFFQDDSYGQSGLKALRISLKKRGLEPTSIGSYTRNTVDVSGAIKSIVPSSPQAIVMVGAYAPCSEFIKKAKALGLADTTYCNISFVGTRALVAQLGSDAEGIIISQVVPHPSASSIPQVETYRKALKRYSPDATPDWISLEGYLEGRLFAELIRRSGDELTKASFASALNNPAPIDLNGLTAVFGPNHNQAFDSVYLTQVHEGQINSIR